MANYILKKDVDILRCNNGAMNLLYETLKEVIKAEGLEKNEVLMDFLDHLDQEDYGMGSIYVDIDNYFNGGNGKLLIDLLDRLIGLVIDKIKFEYELHLLLIRRFEEFKQNIKK